MESESGQSKDRVVFDQYLENNVKIISLPREARIVLTLYSKSIVTEDKQRIVVTSELGKSKFLYSRLPNKCNPLNKSYVYKG